MKILIAPDKFKGSLSAKEVCEILAENLVQKYPNTTIELCPMADGGDGSLTVLADYLSLEKRKCLAKDPLGREIEAHYFISGNRAFIEVAHTSGLVLLKKAERNPLYTSTEGTGIQIKHAIENGAQEIILLLGGSATNDAGLGIAKALGFEFKDEENNNLSPIGDNLKKIVKIIPGKLPDLKTVKFTLLYDVKNPMYGPMGAAAIFAAQKGADKKEIALLEQGLQHLSHIFINQYKKDVSKLPGGGAAGAIAAGLHVLLNAKLENGFNFIADIAKLEEKIILSDVVITGEGQLDKQSFDGKVISGVQLLCNKYGKSMIIVAGKNELSEQELAQNNIHNIYTLDALSNSTQDAMQHAKVYLKKIAAKIKLN